MNARLTDPALSANTREQLQNFLTLAALCGENIPVDLLLKVLDLTEEERDTLIDLLDEHFLDTSPLSFFRDYEYTHPSFPELLIYGFGNPLLRWFVFDRLSQVERDYWAHRLLSRLKAELPVRTPGIAQLFLEVSRHLTSQAERGHYEEELAWWIGVDEAEDLAEDLARQVEEGRLAPHVLWDIVQESEQRWPTYRRLALLDAFAQQPGGIPQQLLGSFYNLRAGLLFAEARYSEALDDALIGLDVVEESSLQVGALHTIVGLVKRETGQYQDALPHLRGALHIVEQILGPQHPSVATTLDNLAGLYHDQGKYEDAEPLYQRALAIREAALGPQHPAIATTLNNLAELYHARGKYADAEPLHQRALAIREAALGPQHPDVATTLDNLAELYRAQGKYADAEPLYQRALAIRETALGPQHPAVATLLLNYSACLSGLDRGDEAKQLAERAQLIWNRRSEEGQTD